MTTPLVSVWYAVFVCYSEPYAVTRHICFSEEAAQKLVKVVPSGRFATDIVPDQIPESVAASAVAFRF